jgi:hypothetical protein
LDLWIKHRGWAFPPIHYSSLDALIGALDEKIIKLPEVRFAETDLFLGHVHARCKSLA